MHTTADPLLPRREREHRALFVCAAPEDEGTCRLLAAIMRPSAVRVLWAPEHQAGAWKQHGPPAAFGQCTTFVALVSPAAAASAAVRDQARWASILQEEEPERLLLALPAPTLAEDPIAATLRAVDDFAQWYPLALSAYGNAATYERLVYSGVHLLRLPAFPLREADVADYMRFVEQRAGNASFDVLLAYGRASLWWGNLPAALRWFEQAVAVRSTSSAAHHCRGLVLARLGQFHNALEAFDAALPTEGEGLADMTPTTLVEKGTVLRRLGRYQEALQAYRERLDYPPMDGRTWYGLAATASKFGTLSDVVLGVEQGFTHALLYGVTEIDASDDVLDAHDSLARNAQSAIEPQLIQVSRALVEHARGKSDMALEVCHTIRIELSTDAPADTTAAVWAAEAVILQNLGREHDAAQLLIEATRHVGEDNAFLTRLREEVAHPLQLLP